MLVYNKCDPLEQTSVKYQSEFIYLHLKNAFEIVVEMAAILSRCECVDNNNNLKATKWVTKCKYFNTYERNDNQPTPKFLS